MINQEQGQTIPCPVCSSKIPFNVQQLLLGVAFPCSNVACDAVVALAPESKPMVQEAVQQLESLKKNM